MAKTTEQNERLVRVGPGTPMGELLRRYWHPVAVTPEFDENPVRKIRLLGEDLTLFRSKAGEYGLVGDRCPHRCLSIEYGIPDQRGCAAPTTAGCLIRPEPASSSRSKRGPIRNRAFTTKSISSRIRSKNWAAWSSPTWDRLPAPLLPRWDLLVQDDLIRTVDIHPLPCNWLQCMDNSLDPLHFEFLHGEFGNYQMERLGRPPGMVAAHHVKIDFAAFEYGIHKFRLLEGESEDAAEWTVGHPILFPAILAVGDDGSAGLHYRVPVDDTHTLQFTYNTARRKAGEPVKPITVSYQIYFDDNGKVIVPIDTILKQDMVAWVGQGPISTARRRASLIRRPRRDPLPQDAQREHGSGRPRRGSARDHPRPGQERADDRDSPRASMATSRSTSVRTSASRSGRSRKKPPPSEPVVAGSAAPRCWSRLRSAASSGRRTR